MQQVLEAGTPHHLVSYSTAQKQLLTDTPAAAASGLARVLVVHSQNVLVHISTKVHH